MPLKRRSRAKQREEARQMYLTGDVSTNAEIASRLGVKPHTVGRWRKDEDWDGLRLKIDVRAGERFIEKIATERVSLNVCHYRFWDVLLARLADDLKDTHIQADELAQAQAGAEGEGDDDVVAGVVRCRAENRALLGGGEGLRAEVWHCKLLGDCPLQECGSRRWDIKAIVRGALFSRRVRLRAGVAVASMASRATTQM